MEVRFTLALPRDQVSVPVARRLLGQSLDLLGVEPEDIGDIQLALSEACTNVLEHSSDGDDYEVTIGIDGEACVLDIVDRGHGFEGDGRGHEEAAGDAESGRGIQLMRALVDRVEFVSRPQSGMVVHLEKRLTWRESAVVHRLESPSEARR